MFNFRPQFLLITGAVIFCALFTYLLSPILTPFVIALILAYMGDPWVDWLELHRFRRTWAVVLVFSLISVVVLALLLVIIPLLQQQIFSLIRQLPNYLEWFLSQFLPRALGNIGVDVSDWQSRELLEVIKQGLFDQGGEVASIFAIISRSGGQVLLWIANLLLIPVVTFYMLRDWDHFISRLGELIPRKHYSRISLLARESDLILGEFFRGQFLVMLALGVIYSIGLWWVGLQFSLLIGLFSALVSFVPYLGLIFGMILASVAALMQFQEAAPLLGVVIVFGAAQLLEAMVLTPLLLGDRIGLHPVAVIFAVMAGGQLFGFFGVLMALPAAAVFMVWLQHSHQHYLQSNLYGRE